MKVINWKPYNKGKLRGFFDVLTAEGFTLKGFKIMESINGASKYTSLSKATLRRSVKSGDLKASNKVGKTMFKQSALESWLS